MGEPAPVTWLRKALRDAPPARAAFIRAQMLLRPSGRTGHVLYLMYHGMKASERASFERQLRFLRGAGDFVGMADSLRALRGTAGTDRFICVTVDDGRRDAFTHAVPILAAGCVPATFFVVPGWLDAGLDGGMTWADARQLAAADFVLGSHGSTHRRLSELDDNAARAELTQSRARIEAASGQACEHFAAPFGQPHKDYRPDRDPAMAAEAGYQTFFTTLPRGAGPGDYAWGLPRVRMEPGWGTAELSYALWR